MPGQNLLLHFILVAKVLWGLMLMGLYSLNLLVWGLEQGLLQVGCSVASGAGTFLSQVLQSWVGGRSEGFGGVL